MGYFCIVLFIVFWQSGKESYLKIISWGGWENGWEVINMLNLKNLKGLLCGYLDIFNIIFIISPEILFYYYKSRIFCQMFIQHVWIAISEALVLGVLGSFRGLRHSRTYLWKVWWIIFSSVKKSKKSDQQFHAFLAEFSDTVVLFRDYFTESRKYNCYCYYNAYHPQNQNPQNFGMNSYLKLTFQLFFWFC